MDKLAKKFEEVEIKEPKTNRDLSVDPSFKYVKKADENRVSKWIDNGELMILDEFPIQLDMELNTTCNLRCKMCPQSFNTPELAMMPIKKLKEILRNCKDGIESIKLQYRGEPLMHPQFVELVEYAKKLGIYVHSNTNATLLTSTMSLKLINAGMDKIICSIDSCYPNSYGLIRAGGNFDKVFDNINRLKQLKYLNNSKKPFVRIQAVRQDINREEIDSGMYERFWDELADEIGIEEIFDFNDDENKTVLEDWHCAQIWQRLVILADGQVLPCCAGINQKTNKVYSVGNVYENTIKEIWNGKEMTLLRVLHRKGKTHEIEMCRICRLRKLVIKIKIKEILNTKNE